jgi:Domain of unknown function (DUF4340)
MNFRTTLLLLVLAAGGGAAYWYRHDIAARLGHAPPSADATPDALYILRRIRPESISRIEVSRDGNTVELVREGKAWTLPGGWPTRGPEVQDLVDLLTDLDSRFEPMHVGADTDLSPYGLAPAQKPVAVTMTVAQPGAAKTSTFRLFFGESPDHSGNPFTRPTYFRLEDQNQILRGAPGLMLVLNRPKDSYRKRQLFPEVERVRVGDPRPTFPGEPEPPRATVSLLDARRVTVSGPAGSWTLQRRSTAVPHKPGADMTSEQLAEDWELVEPVRDAVDPEKLRAALTAVPELWVENFVAGDPGLEGPAKTLKATGAAIGLGAGGVGEVIGVAAANPGLSVPERTIKVETDQRTAILLLGAVSREVEKKAPPPPPGNPLGAPPPVKEVYRFARLVGNSQVFEIKADKLGELFAAATEVRDGRLARFRSADARRVEIAKVDGQIALVDERDEEAKEDHWKLLVAGQSGNADGLKVTDLVDRIAELQANGQDIIDGGDPKKYGLDPTVSGPRLTVELSEPAPGGDEKARRKRTVTIRIGRRDADKNKIYLQVDSNPRIDFVGGDFLKLFDRPAIAYRSPRVIDANAKQIAAITIQRAGEQFKLAQVNGIWTLADPVSAGADAAKAATLADNLSRLESSEFVSDNPTPEDLAKYGLTTPALTATLTFADPSRPPKTLQIGAAREGKPELYARLTDNPCVFAVRDAIKTTIDQPSLAYRPLQLWQVAPQTVTAIEVQRGEEKSRLSRDGSKWKLSGPFDAPASVQAVIAMVGQLTAVRAERFEANTTADAAKYGLDKPVLRVTVFAEKTEPRSLVIGNTTAADGKTRFAKAGDSDAVVVVSAALATVADRPALDLIDPVLLSLNPDEIVSVAGTGPIPESGWAVVRKNKNDEWMVTALKPPAPADRIVVEEIMRIWTDLRAERFVAYGPTVDWARYGLDNPAATLTVGVRPAGGDPSVSHILEFGKAVDGASGQYARLDHAPGVFIVPPAVVKHLVRSPQDVLDRTLYSFTPEELAGIRRSGSAGELQLEKSDGGWQIVKPAAQKADQPALEELARQLGGLRAVRFVATNVTDLKQYGLDSPVATVEPVLKDTSSKPAPEVLKIGGPFGTAGERYTQLREGGVFILPAALAKTLVAAPIKFRDRTIAQVAEVDRIFVEGGSRHVIFAKLDGAWKMTEPLAAEAEAAELDELLGAMARLRADELVAEKPADLKTYGLDPPEVRWRMLSGDREVLNLLIGKRDVATGRNFAKLAASDMVFLLSPELSNRLLAEHRKRTLWAGVDPAAVDTLAYSVGDQTLVLQKANDGWQSAGRPEQMVNAAAVNDVVAALAGLKVERFVVDKDADLKQFGLQPPQRTISARGPGGVVATLYLGKTEDGSKRVYARVLDAKRSDVFVISEADAARLVKDLKMFVK